MTSPEMKKAPAATGAIRNRSTNYQKEEPMTTTLHAATANGQTDEFATIHVAGATVSAHHLVDGTLTVELDHGDEGGIKVYTLGAACALAAALSAVAVHQMEQSTIEAVAA